MDFLVDNIYLVVIAVVSGGLLLFPNLLKAGGDFVVDVTRATQLINHEHGVLIDIRDETAFNAAHIGASRHIAATDLNQKMAKLNKTKPVILVGQTDKQAVTSLKELKKQEFTAVYVLAGGLDAWKKAGLPVVQSKGNKNA